MTLTVKTFLGPIALACALCCALAGTASAASSSAASSTALPCWKLLLNDWYDGHISKIYPIPCYHQAINHLPTDITVYSSAKQDIENALAQAIALKRKGEKTGQSIPVAQTTTTTETTTSANGTKTTHVVTTIAATTTTATVTGRKKKHGVEGAIQDLNPSSPDSFPLPLLILGALAILLVLAGLGGMLYRRYAGGGGDDGGDSGASAGA